MKRSDDWVWCATCQKRRYWTRRAARAVVRRLPGRRMSPYQCPAAADGWHVGHLPARVRLGKVGRDAHYAADSPAA